MEWPQQSPGTVADIALILEGTYPFVSGGVSSWVHEIIRGLPDRTFSLLFIGGSPDHYGPLRFELPANVVHLECHYLTAPPRHDRPRLHPGATPAFELSARLHQSFKSHDGSLGPLLAQVADVLGKPSGISRESFLHSEAAWDAICDDYESRSAEPSFLEYFWTVRTMHAPLFTLVEAADGLPQARVIHAACTGYAGFLGMLLHHRRRVPFVLTEHGIYTKERRIDLAHAPWIHEDRSLFSGNVDEAGYLRQLWVRFYEGLGRCAYAAAHPIIALYEGNRQRQIADGADVDRTRVIPNGIDLARFKPLRLRRPDRTPLVLGLIGRVVPIKDVTTFIRAMRSVCDRIVEAEGWVVGPSTEDEDYGRECEELVRSLGLNGRVKFLGFRSPESILPQLGVLVLTSISEALPLVILEAFASGLPVVATDVGACRELVEGRTPEDRTLGAAGIITPIASPDETAEAAIQLLRNEPRWRAAQAAGLQRVERFYTQEAMLESYRAVYDGAASWRA